MQTDKSVGLSDGQDSKGRAKTVRTGEPRNLELSNHTAPALSEWSVRLEVVGSTEVICRGRRYPYNPAEGFKHTQTSQSQKHSGDTEGMAVFSAVIRGFSLPLKKVL